MSKFFYIKVGLNTHWGYSFRRTIFSKTRDSYLLPPPTTLIGALAYGLAKIKGLPEEVLIKGVKDWASSSELLREELTSVHVRVNSPLHHHSDLSRIWWFRKRERRSKFDAVALGKVYTSLSYSNEPHLDIIYIFNESTKDKIKELIAATYSITRLGCKEAIVSVKNVNYGYAEVISDESVSTSYSFWLDLVDTLEGDVVIQEVIDYRVNPLGNYLRATYGRYVYPYNQLLKKPSIVKVKLRREVAKALKVGSEVVIIGFRK